MNETLETVKEPMNIRCSSKEYVTGRLLCEQGHTYLMVLENPNHLFPSITVLHSVELVYKDAASPPYDIFLERGNSSDANIKGRAFSKKQKKSNASMVATTPARHPSAQPEADREAKIEDLLNFVFEITAADTAAKANKKKSGSAADKGHQNASEVDKTEFNREQQDEKKTSLKKDTGSKPKKK